MAGSCAALLRDVRALGREPGDSSSVDLAERNLANRLRRARKAGWLSHEQEAELERIRDASQLAAIQELMQQIRDLGRLPTKRDQWSLWNQLSRARSQNQLRPEDEEELGKFCDASQLAAAKAKTDELMQKIRHLGRLPQEINHHKKLNESERAERALGEDLRRATASGHLSSEDHAEIANLRELDLVEVNAPPDPMDPFAEEAANRLEQDLLMFSNGIRPKMVQRRVARYKKFMGDSALQETAVVKKYRDQVLQASATSAGLAQYVSGADIQGDELRTFSDEPIFTGPLVCQLCDDADFLYEPDFALHKDNVHSGENEYRKRVLYLMEQCGSRAITGQEKRIMVQNFSHFQQFSRPGAKGNNFSRIPEVPRCEAACALCQQKDFVEYRHKLCLFGTPPADGAPQPAASANQGASLASDDADDRAERSDQDPFTAALLKHGEVYYIASPERVQELLDVERYAKRWPQIPASELHASSIQHPDNDQWRWLLHARRVPVLPPASSQLALGSLGGASQPADMRPPCAGVGDPSSIVFACWDCLADIAAKKPKLPLNSCANDNWVGRERAHVREASQATKMLASLGRCCWKQIRLGRQGDPAVQEQALTGNTIFFAQPTADVPSMELPPPLDALVDSLNVIYTRNMHDLSKAEWAVVNREQYMRLVRERKQCCPVFSNVIIREDEAASRLPTDGVPEQIASCALEVDGVEKAPARLQGPASRAPEVGKNDEAGDVSEEGSESDPDAKNEHDDHAHVRLAEGAQCDVAEASIAVDPAADVKPVKMMQALQGNIEALQAHAEKIMRNEKTAKIEDKDGVLQPVVDEGGRQCMQAFVLDVQSTARAFDEGTQAALERAVAQTDHRLTLCPQALAIPTQGPLDSFNARTYPACYVEWWFGDGAPGLDRERPMLYEQVARRLINIEEHEYALADDAEPYRASPQSRFNKPEIIAVLGDVIRRMRLLKGTRAAIGRKGFTADLKAIAEATSAEFLEAMNIAGPRETIGSATTRSDMPPKVKTALRTLLLSTSDVPGTEGRKTRLRFDGHGNNLKFGGPNFFATPNFADTYSPLVKLLHDGPCADYHLNMGSASQPADSARLDAREGFLTCSEPRMPSLRRMHEIVAADPRAQAKFFLLMSELHYRYIIGLERLHIGRITLARPPRPVHDEVASSLQPSVTPGTTDVQVPLEAQGRGFTHGHGKGHSFLGPTMRWLRRALATGLTSAVCRMRETLLGTAVTVQYDAAREPGRQLGVDVREEPFTIRQQRQSRMDGGEDEDGTLRERVELAPPVEQPHVERERCRAAAESRLPLIGTAAYRNLPLTGAFQSTFPRYRQMPSFGRIGDASQLTSPDASTQDAVQTRRLRDIYRLDECGQIVEILMADGTVASDAELTADAKQWAAHFAQDSFNNHCTNNAHDCTETCIKYAKKKLQAKQSLLSHKVPSCRFWFFRVKRIGKKRRRRRGKPLVKVPYIAETDDRNQEFRCQVKREQPFRSTSNDVAQVLDRCNVDFQFLECAPSMPIDDEDPGTPTALASSGALQPAVPGDGAPQPVASADLLTAASLPQRRRLTKKTPGIVKKIDKKASIARKPSDTPAWFPGWTNLSKKERACIASFAASFQKAAAMDFYITKYQGKPMETLTPLFICLTDGIHRLERQEQQEQEEEATAKEAQDADGGEPSRKRRKILEDLARRARRVTIRLASMGNRCFWLSAAELVVHILTDGDCIQSHNNVSIFTRQLQWAMQQCKRQLNHETSENPSARAHQSVQAVCFKVAKSGQDDAGAGGGSESDSDVSIDQMEACTASTNASDDYAHRGSSLSAMPYYVYRMYVRRVSKPSRAKTSAPDIFMFEPHYVLAKMYVQEVVFTRIHVPTIDGFQCPTAHQDAEQNSLLKAILFSPWSCTDPMTCGSVLNFKSHLSNGTSAGKNTGNASQLAASSGSASQPAAPLRSHTFKRAWMLRSSEINVLAGRADCRCAAARKKLVLADTTLFAEIKEPMADIQKGEDVRSLLRAICARRMQRTMPMHGTRLILAFLGIPCRWHGEQCTLAEFSAYIARDVTAHIDLAAEARIRKPKKKVEDADSDDTSESEEPNDRMHSTMEFLDVGGGGDGDVLDACHEDVPCSEISNFPLHDVGKTIALCLQQDELGALPSKTRKSQGDLDLKALDDTYTALLKQDFGMELGAKSVGLRGFGRRHVDMIALQKKTIALAKKQQSAANDSDEEDAVGDSAPSRATQPAEPQLVPLPLAMQGPGAVALKLLTDAECTEEQIDAVSLLALSLQKRFDARPDKSKVRLPVATTANNHRAVWLGGGGVGKTRTLSKVVQPLAETYFGDSGYCAAAQSNQAAQNLGSRGRTLHAANGLLFRDSLQTARLRLNPQTQKKMDRLGGELGVDVIDELGCVPGDLLHADALRKTYGRCLRYNLDATKYMKPAETWGRMPAKILCGDFLQLPPVPQSASLLSPPTNKSYEQQQGRKLLLDMEYVVDFVQMRRFNDPLLVEVLESMRTPGGRKISEDAWKALEATVIRSDGTDQRLRDARGWYECAYEWRLVSYAMHAHARLNAKAAGKILFYIPAVDIPSARMTREDFDAMRAQPNISTSAKFPGILPTYISMEMILTESYLPPLITRGTPVEVVGIEPHPREPPLDGRPSIVSQGCAVLHYMPKCIYVRAAGCKEVFLQSDAGAPQPGVSDLRGVLAVQPTSRQWMFKTKAMENAVSVSRTQCPLLPRKQCTLHGVQGKTADPGFIAHWTFPKNLSKDSIWLAYYVSLSRPRGFAHLLCHSLPDREIIECGPPETITAAFKELFEKKIKATKRASARARAELSWPARK